MRNQNTAETFTVTETTVFNSITYGQLPMRTVIWKILSYMATDPYSNYEIAVGTDSMTRGNNTKFAIAITVHKEHKGAIFFYKTLDSRPIKNLRQKLDAETQLSITVAGYLIDVLGDEVTNKDNKVHLVIHMDIGEKGPTSALIAELEGWVTALGYDFRIKPDSQASSFIADRYSK